MNTLFKIWPFILGFLLAQLAFSLLAPKSHADDYVDLSLGLFKNSYPTFNNVKFIQIGHRDYIYSGIFTQYEGGGWVQQDVGDGRKSSGYAAGQVGIEADGPIAVRIAFGPSLITTPDSFLGGMFQFTSDVFLGVQGNNGNTIGMKYKHFSSAGIEMPNAGRDFAGLELTVLW